jgi:hypothetical protein
MTSLEASIINRYSLHGSKHGIYEHCADSTHPVPTSNVTLVSWSWASVIETFYDISTASAA